MAKRTQIDNDTLAMFSELGNRVKQSRAKEHQEQFKKPTSDYYRLDLVVRDTAMGSKGHPIMTKDIKKDYKEYLSIMSKAEGISMTKYLHKLIEEDMQSKEKQYKAIKKLTRTI